MSVGDHVAILPKNACERNMQMAVFAQFGMGCGGKRRPSQRQTNYLGKGKMPEGNLWLLEADLFRRTSLFIAHQAALRESCMAAKHRKAA